MQIEYRELGASKEVKREGDEHRSEEAAVEELDKEGIHTASA